MSKELLKNTEFRSKVRKFYSENKNKVLDILLFGSAMKGKVEPRDVDVLIVYKNKKDFDLGYKLKKSLDKYKAEITEKTYKELFDTGFKAKEALLSEGYSLVNNRKLSKALGYSSYVLFKYSLKGLSKSRRMTFYYSLHGRDNEGVLRMNNAIKFSDTIILSPVENAEKIKDFFNTWKIETVEFPILIPETAM